MVPSPAYARATMCDPERARSAASGPPVDPLTARDTSASRPRLAHGIAVAIAVPADTACIGRDSGPNQPRYTSTSLSPGCRRGRAKCSEEPTEIPGRVLPFTSKEATRLAARSVWMRPSRHANAGSSIPAANVAAVPPLGRARPVLLEDAPDEGSLAGRVEVVRAHRDRRLGCRTAPAAERAHRRDQHIPRLDERAHRLRPRHVGYGDLQASELVAQGAKALDVA